MNLAEYGKLHRTRERGTEDGSVKQTGTKTKKWEGVYHAYVPDGAGGHKRITRRRIIGECSKMTKTQAREEHREWIRRFNSEPVADTAKATVGQMADDYYLLKVGDWNDQWRMVTRALIQNIIKPALGPKPLEAVTPEMLKTFVNSLPGRTTALKTVSVRADGTVKTKPAQRQRTGISTSYARKTITFLRAMFDLAVERDLIRKNPARSITIRLSMPKAAKAPDKPVFPPAQLPALLAELEQPDTLIVWLSMLAATRPNELFAMKGADVGPDFVHIHRALDRKLNLKPTKTERPRFVSLPPQIAEELHGWIAASGVGPDDFVFTNSRGGAINRQYYLQSVLKPAAARAMITATVDFRMLRRSFATIANALGFDLKSVQAQMGHARPDITATEYIQPVDAVRREQMKRLEDVLRGRAPMPADILARLGSARVQ
jgi:integrase